MRETMETRVAERGNGTAPGFRLQTFNSLRHRDYRLLWISIILSSTGQWMEQIALSWLIYQMTGSPFMLGSINAVRAVPFLILGPLAGVAADRVNRKMLMIVGQAYVMFLTIVMGTLIITELVEVWHLFAYTALTGVGWCLTQPVRQALVPNLVPKEDLMNAVALQSAGFNATRIIGPTVAGFLVAWIGVGGAFYTKAAFYVGILTLLYMINVPPLRVVQAVSFFESFKGGFRYILKNEAVLWLIVLALIPMLFMMPYVTLMPVFVKDVLGMDAKGYGILMSAVGVGALVGTLIVASLGNYKGKGKLLLGCGVVMGLALILFANAYRIGVFFPSVQEMVALGVSLFVLVFVGGFSMPYMALTNTLLQMNIADEVRGRVMSIYMLDQGLAPLGSLYAGSIAQFFGAPLAVTVMGSTCVLLVLLAIAKVPQVRRLE